jgi:hypothetical protein
VAGYDADSREGLVQLDLLFWLDRSILLLTIEKASYKN